MAKVKTKRGKVDFKTGIQGILEAHSLYLEQEQLDPLLEDMLTYFNSVYKPDDSIPFFADLVKHYMSIYEELTEEKPAFNPIQAVNLKRLCKTLEKRYLKINPQGIWDSHTAITQLELFYRHATTIPFYKSSFSASMLYSKFDEIISQLAAKRKSQEEIDKKILG